MYKEIDNKFYFSVYLNNQIFILPELEKYIRLKLKVKRIKYKTLVTKLSAIKTFILWSLTNPASNDEDLMLYLARYLDNAQKGIRIYDSIFVAELNENIDHCIVNSKGKKASTIDKDKAILEDFLKSTNQDLFEAFNLQKNIQSLNKSSKNSIHDGYVLRMGTLAQKAFANEISIIPNQSKSINGDIKAFPFQLFDDLLSIANPREKLIYLLCGACSARASQTLNLTLYDFDYKNKNVWLIDPRNNEQLGVHGVGRKQFLRDMYDIDASVDKPHVNFGFKAPIPLRFKERLPLYWISNNYRDLFLKTLSEYNIFPESSRMPKHPFFFTTSTGKRLTQQQVNTTFKNHCDKLKKMYPNYAVQLDGLGLHSLRHMFGVMMATFQAHLIISGNKNNIPLDQIKIITKEAMGHKNLSSTDIYFNRPWHINIELGEHITKLFDNMLESGKYELLKGERYGKRSKK